MIEYLNKMLITKQVVFEAGSLTTSLNYMIPGWPRNALSILIYLFILLFLTGLRALITILVSSLVAMPVYTSEYFPFPILVII